MNFILGAFVGGVCVSLWFYREQVKDKAFSLINRLKITYIAKKEE